jgi:hypothetical protein
MLDLTYNLRDHGWATACVSNGDAFVEMTASYLSDALGDFARAVRGLMRGLPETTFSFLDEPGEHRIVLKRDGEAVHATVHWFEDDDGADLQHGRVVLTGECGIGELVTTTISCLRKVLDMHGEAGYRERWQKDDFPMREYRDLLEWRREHAAAR